MTFWKINDMIWKQTLLQEQDILLDWNKDRTTWTLCGMSALTFTSSYRLSFIVSGEGGLWRGGGDVVTTSAFVSCAPVRNQDFLRECFFYIFCWPQIPRTFSLGCGHIHLAWCPNIRWTLRPPQECPENCIIVFIDLKACATEITTGRLTFVAQFILLWTFSTALQFQV